MKWVIGSLYGLLFVIAGALAAYIGYLGYRISTKDGPELKELAQPLAVALVGLLGVGGVVLQLQSAAMREREQREKARDNVTAAVRAEMKSIMTIISYAHIPEQFAVRFVHPEGKFLWADAAREEDYLTVYKALSGQFGLIKAPKKRDATGKTDEEGDAAATIGKVVDFYNYFKAARDATAPLLKTQDSDRVRQASKGVVTLLQRMFEAGKAIDLWDPQFDASKQVMDAFRTCVEAHPTLSNNELAAIWAGHPVFATIPDALFPLKDEAPAATKREPVA